MLILVSKSLRELQVYITAGKAVTPDIVSTVYSATRIPGVLRSSRILTTLFTNDDFARMRYLGMFRDDHIKLRVASTRWISPHAAGVFRCMGAYMPDAVGREKRKRRHPWIQCTGSGWRYAHKFAVLSGCSR